LVVEPCSSLLNWLGWTKLDVIEWYYSLSQMIFSMSFSKVLMRIIEQNILGELYNALLGFGMIIEVDILKWDS